MIFCALQVASYGQAGEDDGQVRIDGVHGPVEGRAGGQITFGRAQRLFDVPSFPPGRTLICRRRLLESPA
jgi:hypothetical protein